MVTTSMGGRAQISFLPILKRKLKLFGYSDVPKSSPSFSSTSVTGSDCDDDNYDIVVVGGGIVGIASARELKQRQPELKMCIVEKEPSLGAHQTGHNSGVIHAGMYYKPGSLRAKMCVKGNEMSFEYCEKYEVPYKKNGKLIVATNENDCKILENLFKRGKENKVKGLEIIDSAKIKEIEPHCTGIKAMFSPNTGIVDWREFALSLAENFKKSGGIVHTDFKVKDFRTTEVPGALCKYPVTVLSEKRSVRARFVLACGGLQSDLLAAMTGCKPDPRIIPFRGEYLVLAPNKSHLVNGNIYPVPDPRYPFLGVHFTPRMDGTILLGPNAVLALKREGYSWSEYDFKELADVLRYRGFLKLATKNVPYGVREMLKSAFMSLQLKDLQKYIPELKMEDITRGPAGVRAQALDSNGSLVDDFVFDKGIGHLGERVLHCRNAPSPACTSALALAEVVADRVLEEMNTLEFLECDT